MKRLDMQNTRDIYRHIYNHAGHRFVCYVWRAADRCRMWYELRVMYEKLLEQKRSLT